MIATPPIFHRRSGPARRILLHVSEIGFNRSQSARAVQQAGYFDDMCYLPIYLSQSARAVQYSRYFRIRKSGPIGWIQNSHCVDNGAESFSPQERSNTADTFGSEMMDLVVVSVRKSGPMGLMLKLVDLHDNQWFQSARAAQLG